MERKHILKQRGVFLLPVLSCVALLWLAPPRAGAQFLPGAGGIIDQDVSRARVKARTDPQRKGPDILEWTRRLRDDEPETRLGAVRSLGDSKDPKAIEHLLTATADADIRVKVKAIEYLGTLRATDATPVLAQQLFLRDVGPGVKRKVLIALGKIGDPRGADPIMDFLKRDLDLATKSTALFALREVGNDRVLAYLESISHHETSPPLRRLANEAAISIRQR
ncbi:MAG: HEAT repeat domain-containing protein, partial [Candidatus Binatia bacterium]